jgi:hypothetical protein
MKLLFENWRRYLLNESISPVLIADIRPGNIGIDNRSNFKILDTSVF